MKQRLLFLSLVVMLLGVGVDGWGQILQWNTFGNTGTETTEPSTYNDPNVSAANLTQGSITAAANGNRFGGSGWFNTGNTAAGNTLAEAVAGNDYIQFIVTPNSGFSFTPTSFVFNWDKSGTGPKNVTLRSSTDSYATDLGTVAPVAAIGTSNTITISGLNALTTATTFRIYGYGATATGGTGGFDVSTNVVNVQLNGTTAPTSNTAPIVTTQAPTSVLTTTATGNGNITATGGVDPTKRGFCWDLATNADPDVDDSKVEETGTFSTGAFTGSISGLTAGTQYKVRAYATNTEGTGYGGVQNFYTLSTQPSAHAASFSSSTVSQTQIDLTFSAASTITNAAGYIVLQRTGAAPTGAPADGSAYSVGNAIGDGTVAAVITNTASTTASITGLSAGTQYYFSLFPFNWDGATNATYNYKTDESVPGTNATTTAPLATTSEVSGPALGSQPNPVTISSLITTDGAAVRVFDMDIFDYGVDTDPTKVTQLTIKAGTNNTANWANSIQGIKLSTDGGATFVTIGSPTIGASSIVIPVASGNLNIPNDYALKVALYIYLKSSGITDNQILEFKVDQTAASHGFVADATGSTFTTTFPTAPVSNQILIDVEATKLAFVQQPTNVGTSANISPAVTISANDANDNRDLDYTTTVSVSATGLTASPVSVSPVSGLATFSTLTFADAASGVTLEASSGTLTNATSSSFDILLLPLAGEIVINQFSPEYNGASNEYIELLNRTNKTFDLSLLKILYSSTGGSGPSSMGTLSGTLLPYSFWLLSPDATISVGLTNSINRNGSFTAGMSASGGQIGISTLDNQIIDGVAYGSITVNRLGEGTAASAPSTDGGLKRVSEGIDNNANSTDFTTVANTSIYLRNSNSVCIASTYTLPATSYPADVVVSGAAPAVTLSGNTTITGKLSVLSGSVTVGSSQQLTVSGTLTNSAGASGLVIESDATGTGSLIHSTAGVAATVERYIASHGSVATDGWHLIGSPVATFNIDGSSFDPGANDDIYAWNEATNTWLNHKAGDPTQIVAGTGYIMAYENTGTKNFSGNLNVADVSVSGLAHTAAQGKGWHLLGNPFASALEWNKTGGSWALTNVAGTAKVWNSTTKAYVDLSANGIIPAAQGFFVQVNEGTTGSLTIPAAARAHSSTAWYKNTTPRLMLSASSIDGSSSQESQILIENEATNNFDFYYDARFLAGYAPQFYSLCGGEMLSTNVLSQVQNESSIPFGFVKNQHENFVIRLEENNLGQSVYIKDLKLNLTHNLSQQPEYYFTSTEGDNPNRFLLHFGAVGVSEQSASATLKAYVVGAQLYFPLQGEATLEIVDLQGRVLQQSKVSGQGLASQPMQLPAGAYVVRLTSGQSAQTAKVIVK